MPGHSLPIPFHSNNIRDADFDDDNLALFNSLLAMVTGDILGNLPQSQLLNKYNCCSTSTLPNVEYVAEDPQKDCSYLALEVKGYLHKLYVDNINKRIKSLAKLRISISSLNVNSLFVISA